MLGDHGRGPGGVVRHERQAHPPPPGLGQGLDGTIDGLGAEVDDSVEVQQGNVEQLGQRPNCGAQAGGHGSDDPTGPRHPRPASAGCVRSLAVTHSSPQGLALHPFRAVRPAVDSVRLGRLLCPPYDVIDPAARAALLDREPDNAVGIILPQAPPGQDAYRVAAATLDSWIVGGLWAVDVEPAIYVYEMRTADGASTRGLVGAVELRDPADGVILPHENTMAGPVSDRLALMTATQANLEPIYLVYDGGGAASEVVRSIDATESVAETTTPDGTHHTLWAVTDAVTHQAIADDLRARKALIADGHHRYATYCELQSIYDVERGAGPWDRGLTLLVDSSEYGPQVHAIHRVVTGLTLDEALSKLSVATDAAEVSDADQGLDRANHVDGFAAVLTDGERFVLITERAGGLAATEAEPGEPAALAGLDVTVLHRILVEDLWGLPDTVDVVGYAHSVGEAVADARSTGGFAILLRPTPVADVAAVAAEGGRMPRKSTLFTPKPASGLLMRRFADES